MEKRPSYRERLWQAINSASTWSWLIGFVPRPIREWLRDNLWSPILTALLMIGVLALGVLQGIALFWLVIGTLGASSFAFWISVQVQSTVERFKARRRAFKVRAISGPTSGTFFIPAGGSDLGTPAVVYARLAVEPQRFLRNCSATITGVKGLNVVKGKVKGKDKTIRTWHDLAAGFPCEIGWEGNGRARDLAPGVARGLDVAVLDQADQTKFAFVAADGRRVELPPGWYKVEVTLISESDDPAMQVVEMVVAFGPREGMPPPLQALLWKDEYEHSLGSKD